MNRLKQIFQTLGRHHSRDPTFLAQISAEITSEVLEPWKCLPCKRLCSGRHQHCAQCGQQWKTCANPDFVPYMRRPSNRQVHWTQPQWEEEEWPQDQWVQSPRRRQLPRRRSRRPQPKQKAAKGKGRGKNSAELPSYGPQSLPAMPSVDPPWLASLNAAPAPGSNASQPTTGLLETKEDKECDRQMKSLVAALRRRKDELPEDLQTLVKEVTVRSGQEETKLLHSAVSQHGRAKKEVSEAQAARLQMHAAWRNFLEQSVEQWTRYTAQFVEQEKQLMDRLKQAQDSLLAAKENLGACKSAAGLIDKEETALMSDGEEADAKDTEAIASQKIAASFKDFSRDRSRAGSVTQTPKDCSHRDASRSIRTQSAVFWHARVNTHAKCIAPGLSKPHAFGEFFKSYHPANAMTDQPTSVPAHCFFNPAMTWLHSVVHEPDFVDPWTAIS